MSLWEIDVDQYTETNIERLRQQARVLRRAHGEMSDTLVTKIMLGVFGSVPAFDTNFRQGFGVTTFGPKALRRIGAFYQANADMIDRYCVQTIDFRTGMPTQRRYTKAKVIDMAFFVEGWRT